jgi:hypothetical protein
VREEELGYREMHRVLRPDGMAIAQVPIARNLTRAIEADESAGEGELLKNFGHIDALRMYGLDYPEKLKRQASLSENATHSRSRGSRTPGNTVLIPVRICTWH